MRDAFETVSVGVIRYLSSQAAPVPVPAQPAFSNFDFSALFSTPGVDMSAGQAIATSDTGPTGFQTSSRQSLEEATFDEVPVDAQSSARSPDATLDNDVTMTVPNAVNAIDRFFSNPFIELGAISDLDLTVEPNVRSSATAKRTAILDQAFRS